MAIWRLALGRLWVSVSVSTDDVPMFRKYDRPWIVGSIILF